MVHNGVLLSLGSLSGRFHCLRCVAVGVRLFQRPDVGDL